LSLYYLGNFFSHFFAVSSAGKQKDATRYFLLLLLLLKMHCKNKNRTEKEEEDRTIKQSKSISIIVESSSTVYNIPN
jgi:hypothetical protein